MKVLVSGANGLLGHHVVSELLKQYHVVRIIVRSKRNIYFDLASVEVYEGNFADYHFFKETAAGCDAIIHIAAVTGTNLLHYEDYYKINVEASSQMIKVADELKINRLVFVSTANTIGYGTKERPADESCAIEFPFSKSFYAQSKIEAEKLFLEASKKQDRHVLIINPTFIVGSHDSKPSSGKLLLLGYNRRLMFVPGGGKNFVAVKVVATAVCNALTLGKNGEKYLVSGVNLSFKEFYQMQKSICEYNQKIIELPHIFLELAGKAGDIIRMLNIKTEICSMNLNQLKIREYYDYTKAKTELNLPETDLKQAIKEAIEWFIERKHIHSV